MKRIFKYISSQLSVGLILSVGLLCPIKHLFAQHLRIFACAIANDSTGASLGASSIGSGLYQSDDTGKTWKHLGWDNIKCYSMDAVDSSNGRILYEATGLGILRSTDYGAHWKQITDWRISEAMDIAVNQKNPDEIYLATAHGPWRSEDGGKTWNSIKKGLRMPFCSGITIDSIIPNHIFLGAGDGVLKLTGNKIWKKILIFRDSTKIPVNVYDIQHFKQYALASWVATGNNEAYSISSEDSGKSFLCDSIVDKNTPMLLDTIRNITDFLRIYYDVVRLPRDPGLNPGYGGYPHDVGNILMISTLGNGILRFNRPDKSEWVADGHSVLKRQIWTLKDFLVTP